MNTPQAYPLQWPAGRPRTRSRKSSNFGRKGSGYGGPGLGYEGRQALTIEQAVQRLRDEIGRLRAGHAVISTNLDLRLDGYPKSNQRAPGDPGVAVYFTLDSDPVVLACDRYHKIADNIAAIAAHIAASRAIERYGVGTLREVFRGFSALPPATAPDDWRAALGEPTTLAEAEAFYREAMKTAHPDVGGTNAAAARLNAAVEMAREHFGA